MCKWGTDKEVKLCEPKMISKRTKIKVDSCIAPLVQMLNNYGIKTESCCCGHGKTNQSHIRIHSKNILLTELDDCFSVHLKFPYKMDKND